MTSSLDRTPATRTAGAARRLLVCLLPILVGLGGCTTTQPFSFLDGERWNKVEMNTFDTWIVSVDGRSYTINSRIRIDPGRHHIVFQTIAGAGMTYSPQKSLDLDIEPCTRYWFEAKKANGSAQDFEPRINHTEPIDGCAVG